MNARLLAELRPVGFAVAYRMLGSVSEAEDIVQEAFLRLHHTLQDGKRIESPRAYLSTVVTRLCINHLRSARARRETYLEALPEPLVGEPGAAAATRAAPAAQAPARPCAVSSRRLGVGPDHVSTPGPDVAPPGRLQLAPRPDRGGRHVVTLGHAIFRPERASSAAEECLRSRISVAIGGSRCPDERQEIVQRHGEITPGAALCIAVECAAVISEPGLFDR